MPSRDAMWMCDSDHGCGGGNNGYTYVYFSFLFFLSCLLKKKKDKSYIGYSVTICIFFHNIVFDNAVKWNAEIKYYCGS
jgi:hypothetical protein